MIPRHTARLCVITAPHRGSPARHVELARQAIEGGAPMIQLRDKTAGSRQILPFAREIANLCHERGARFLVNDRLDLALAAGADGVHLGQDDLPASAARAALGPGKILGVSIHSIEQAARAQADGADYLGIGPIFETATKVTGYAPLGCAGLRRARTTIALPLIAIGGITHDNVGDVIRAGADGVAVISAIAGAADIRRAVQDLLAAIERAEEGRE